MKKKVYIYDTSKGFSSFIKHYYSDKMIIDVCTNKKNFNQNDIQKYDLCFFMVNDMDDYFNLMKIYTLIEHFFIVTTNKIIRKKINNLNYEDVVFIDFNNSKPELLEEINYNLMLLGIQ